MTHYPFKAAPIESFDQPFEPLPEGAYRCEIVKSDVMPTKDGHGRYVSLQFRIKDGEYKGRRIFQRLNILNRSQKCQEIGKKHLSLLLHSIEHESFDDSDEILNYETIVNLGEENKLYGFSKINSIPEIPDNSEEPPIIAPDDFVDDKIPF
jgi:hypothetical protein